MSKKRLISLILALVIAVGAMPAGALTLAAYSTPESYAVGDAPPKDVVNGTFRYYSQLTKQTESYGFTFRERWFAFPSDAYNHDLARMSLCAAMSAAAKTPENITDLFDKLCFNYSDESVVYPAPAYSFDGEKFDATIGYAIGGKELADGESVLVLVAIRGGRYEQEWAGNFDVGAEEALAEHRGFAQAAAKVVRGIEEYVASLNTNKKVKLWLTGYSRAAAVANVAAHELNRAADSGTIRGVDAGGIFAYCFECPRTVDYRYAGNDGNVFNIVNDADLVTKLAPQKWGFVRYGVDVHLPAGTYFNDFDALSAAEIREYKKIIAATAGELADYATADKKTSADFTDEELDAMAAQYSRTINNQISFLDNLVDSLAANYVSANRFYRTGTQRIVQETVGEMLGKTGIDRSEIISGAMKIIMADAVVWSIANRDKLRVLTDNASVIFLSHYPELCLAWLDSLDGIYDVAEPVIRRLVVNGPATVEIAAIDGGTAQAGSTVPAETFVDNADQKIVMLPGNARCDVRITATGKGVIICQIEELDAVSAKVRRIFEFRDISVKKGDVLTCEPDELYDLSGAETGGAQDANYKIVDAAGQELAPVNEYGPEQAVCRLDVYVEGDGWIFGAGEYVKGEFALLVAAPADGMVFECWRDNSGVVSKSPELGWRMGSDVEFVAVFAKDNANDDDNAAPDATPDNSGQTVPVSTNKWIMPVAAGCGLAAVVAAAVTVVMIRRRKRK